MTPFELAPPARAVISDNGLKEVQKGALVDGFILTDLNRPCCPVPLPLVNNTLGIGHDGVVDENGEMILRSQQRADVALQRKIGLPGTLDGLAHLRVGGIPDQEQRMLDVRPIVAQICASMRLLRLLCMVEEPPGLFQPLKNSTNTGARASGATSCV